LPSHARPANENGSSVFHLAIKFPRDFAEM
jgi:hypothetical protein